jgi:hypothetical protein
MGTPDDTVSTLARVAGVEVFEGTRDALTSAFAAHMEAFSAVEELELGETDAAVTFDPRWHA